MDNPNSHPEIPEIGSGQHRAKKTGNGILAPSEHAEQPPKLAPAVSVVEVEVPPKLSSSIVIDRGETGDIAVTSTVCTEGFDTNSNDDYDNALDTNLGLTDPLPPFLENYESMLIRDPFVRNESTDGQQIDDGPPLIEEMDLSNSEQRIEGDQEERRSRGEKRKFEDDEPFIQDGPCYKVEPRMKVKCRECRDIVSIRNNEDIVCRFASFRKLMYRKGAKGGPVSVGFCNPHTDPKEDDLNLWLPRKDNPPEGLELDLCKNLIAQLGDQFCALIRQETEAVDISKTLGNDIKCWKKIVEGVREMCDACATTIFNYHWSCDTCGYMVCIACFKARQNGVMKERRNNDPGKDEFQWMLCRSGTAHSIEKMLLTQIIPGSALVEIGVTLHKVRWELDIPQQCGCIEAIRLSGKIKVANNTITNLAAFKESVQVSSNVESISIPKEQNLADEDTLSEDSSDEESVQMLKSLIKKTPEVPTENSANGKETNGSKPMQHESSLDILESIMTQNQPASQEKTSYDRTIPIKINTLTSSKNIYPDLPHTWLCNGTLLRLLDPAYEGNYDLFKDLWKRGQPVLVSNVAKKLDQQLWSPAKFSEDFGKQRNDLVNCMTGKIVPGQPMKIFWEGFVDVSKRLKDDNGTPMLLKLKDWPPGDDFAKILPDRFKDLMAALPLKDYTHRTGRLNLAARLPDDFIKPDLGPKMYIAYGDGNHLEKGTTNLHLDISDAVNCMVYVGVPTNCDVAKHNKAVLEAIEDSDCDKLTITRVTDGKELPGALWHIYRPWDADKIRDLLNKVSVESNHAIEANNDPIHDQVAYLDKDLRKRLRDEYNVLGFPIVQCEGDAVFIPAGAPHQVRNLHNCIKIAEDFVSPENVSHCFQLTEEFRNLSETHTNHEDKLQIKNIVYHAVKDALSVLIHAQESNKI